VKAITVENDSTWRNGDDERMRLLAAMRYRPKRKENAVPSANAGNEAFALPSGSCDSHCHVFGPAEHFPFSPNRKYEPEDSPKEALAALHRRLGVERAVIVQASAHGTDNGAMLDALAWRPETYRGVAIIDSDIDDRTLTRMQQAGVRGIRFNFVKSLGGYPDPEEFRSAVERAAHLGWHVVLHLKGEDLLTLKDEIAGLPLPFVIDHMGRIDVALGVGQPAFAALLELVRRGDGWVKLSGAERMTAAPYDDAVPFARALLDAAPERILWGTDFPHPNLASPVDEGDLVQLIPRFARTPEEQERLLVTNPAALYGFA
jgi:predicted TIM-barrel fold metal-dependent hydrolase